MFMVMPKSVGKSITLEYYAHEVLYLKTFCYKNESSKFMKSDEIMKTVNTGFVIAIFKARAYIFSNFLIVISFLVY